jgi:methionyl-tRNA formyltransferase
MRLFIVGQKWLAEQVFDALWRDGHDIAGVAAPRCDDRLARAAEAKGVLVAQPTKALDGQWVPAGVDLIVAAHAHTYIKPSALAASRLGGIGYHPSLLPRHRGRDAIRWAIHMGDPITGGTVYKLDEGADTGDILLQHWCWIRPGDTPEQLWRRDLAPMGLRLLTAAVRDLSMCRARPTKQPDDVATWEPAFHARRLSDT